MSREGTFPEHPLIYVPVGKYRAARSRMNMMDTQTATNDQEWSGVAGSGQHGRQWSAWPGVAGSVHWALRRKNRQF